MLALQSTKQLVDDLGSEEYAKREAATEALIAVGRIAVPDLAEGLARPDEEVRTRAALILRLVLIGDVEVREFRVEIRYREEDIITGVAAQAPSSIKPAPPPDPEPVNQALAAVRALPLDPVERLFLQVEADRTRGTIEVAGLPRTLNRIAESLSVRVRPRLVQDPYVLKLRMEYARLRDEASTPVEAWRRCFDDETRRLRAEFDYIRAAAGD